MDKFYKGQKVHCKRNGDGVVTAISKEDHPIEDHPIIVILTGERSESELKA